MKLGITTTSARRLTIGMAGFALIVSGALVSTPAQAMPAEPVDGASECRETAGRTSQWHQQPDTAEVSEAVKEQVDATLATYAGSSSGAELRSSTSSTSSAASTPSQIRVPVFIHVIHGSHRTEKRIKKRKARRMFRTLRAGFNGLQHPAVGGSGVVFKLKKIKVTRNDRWFHAKPMSRADKQMKRKLHRGTKRTLNIYVNRPKINGLLGFARFPWQGKKKLDGVTISEVSLPGGRARGYNLGDTAIHETGHWLGLLHTFEGGCAGGDGVTDTPPESAPSFGCDVTRNTCVEVDDKPDPVTNFMDYSPDSCMNHFTPGQGVRMRTAFMALRFGR